MQASNCMLVVAWQVGLAGIRVGGDYSATTHKENAAVTDALSTELPPSLPPPSRQHDIAYVVRHRDNDIVMPPPCT